MRKKNHDQGNGNLHMMAVDSYSLDAFMMDKVEFIIRLEFHNQRHLFL